MGFIDFIKKVFSEKKETQYEKDAISFENLVSWAESKKNDLDIKDKQETKKVNELVLELIKYTGSPSLTVPEKSLPAATTPA